GSGFVTVTRDGWTSVVRAITVASGQVTAAIDARLTPHQPQQMISPTLGGTLTSGAVQLRFGPGAVTQATPLRLARVSPQGLAGLLPHGWSPVDAVDIVPAGQTLATP